MANHSIVEYFGDSGGHRCGYCNSSDTNFSHGMWAHNLTCLDYQDLIDRGWRRSGKYLYKPTMKKLCCPMYTIKCNATAFHPSKSQKKVLKKMTKFLTVPKTEASTSANGEEDQQDGPSEICEASSAAFVEPFSGKLPSVVDKVEDININKLKMKGNVGESDDLNLGKTTSRQEPSSMEKSVDEWVKKSKHPKGKTPEPGLGPDPNKPRCRKAKIVRLERKREKLALARQQGKCTSSSSSKMPAVKSLEDLVIDRLPSQTPVHNLKVKLVKVQFDSDEFQATYSQTCDLFAKYQMAIHKDSPGECGERQFKRFLVDSPLQHFTGPGSPPMGFGSFHQQYFLDGKLVAVGVIDILPRCVSSVYLFYDPDYFFLSLGVYSALRELHFTRSLQRTTPSIESYYMGFYIQSCPKMKYKGQYSPSYILCPETYNWIPIEQCRPKIALAKYSRLDDSEEETPQGSTEAVLVLFNRQAMPYQLYAAFTGADDRDEVQEYADLVGPVVSSRMLLFRSG
ncbi:Arginyl-tRNA--protein transferase 1 [Porites harrisoni]